MKTFLRFLLGKYSYEDSVGPIVLALMRCVDFLGKWTSILSCIHRCSDYAPENQTKACRLQQVNRVDRMILIWWLILLLCYWLAYERFCYLWYVALLLLALRIANIIFFNLRVALVETTKTSKSLEGREMFPDIVSLKRSLMLGITNFLELIVCFGAIYAAFSDHVRLPTCEARHFVTFLYLSCITQFTIGYGDVTPLGWLRLIACLQGIAGLVLIVLTISRFASFLKVKEM